MEIKEKIKSLSFKWNDEDNLKQRFAELAPYFISGGYIRVNNDYQIYPTTVEFYFHSEQDGGVKDYIVYHRNNNKIKGDIPYFPFMSLHAHESGYDITFENSEKKYRASVLIREYQVWDVNQKCWLKWDSSEQNFRPYRAKDEKGKKKDGTPINDQVLYLKYILNGFTTNNEKTIDWVDAEYLINKKDINNTPRKNVPDISEFECVNGKYIKKRKEHGKPDDYTAEDYFCAGNSIYYKRCKRYWRFSRKKCI